MTNTLTLRSLDIPTIHKFGIGFDSIIEELMRVTSQQSNTNYPPYNIVQITEDEYLISLAVAGFSLDDLNITKEQNFLIIEGNPPIIADDIIYLHKGISGRAFRREFRLADHVEVDQANLDLGILNIRLKREVPEEQKPKKIAISQNK